MRSLLIGVLFCVATVVSAAPLRPLPSPTGRPVDEAAAAKIGEALFSETLLSPIGVSCATCHQPQHGFAEFKRVSNVGLGNGIRNAPTIINAADSLLQFHDGRTIGITEQATQPLINPIEMANRSVNQALARVSNKYAASFTSVFGSVQNGIGTAVLSNGQQVRSGLNQATYKYAMAAFERQLVSEAPMLNKYLAGDDLALTPEQQIGYGLFVKNDCISCHTPPYFTNHQFLNNGMEFQTRPFTRDDGRFVVDRRSIRAFKVPTLIGVGDTAPYGHSGTFNDLERVIDHYNTGGLRLDGTFDGAQDRRVRPLGMNDYQKKCLKMYLESLKPGI